MTVFPFVGHAVAVGIGLGDFLLQLGPEGGNLRLHVILRIDEAFAVACTGEGGFAQACVANHDVVEGVAVQRGTSILQHLLVGLLGGMCRGGKECNGLLQAYGVLGDRRIGAVVAVGINLVVDAVGPVVVGDLVVLAVHVAVDKILAPDVPHDIPLVG